MIEVGKRYVFAYPVEFTTLPEYDKRRGQIVTVLRLCTIEEANCDWQMWRIQAEDGWIGHADESELVEIH